MIDLGKYLSLPSVGATVGIDQKSIFSIVSSLAILLIIIVLLIAITKKL